MQVDIHTLWITLVCVIMAPISYILHFGILFIFSTAVRNEIDASGKTKIKRV